MKAVIFDMDGVIIDSEPLHKQIEKELLEELGGKISEKEHEKFTGTTDQYMWSAFKEQFNLKPSVDEMIALKKKRFMAQIHEVSLVDHIKKMFDMFHDGGYLVALASSNNRKAVDKIIDQFDLEEYFQVAMSGEDITHGKPDPEIFLETAKSMKVDPTDCLVIEDAKNGVEAAKSANMKCIGFDNPNSGEQDLSKADLIIDNYGELNLDEVKKIFE